MICLKLFLATSSPTGQLAEDQDIRLVYPNKSGSVNQNKLGKELKTVFLFHKKGKSAKSWDMMSIKYQLSLLK